MRGFDLHGERPGFRTPCWAFELKAAGLLRCDTTSLFAALGLQTNEAANFQTASHNLHVPVKPLDEDREKGAERLLRAGFKRLRLHSVNFDSLCLEPPWNESSGTQMHRAARGVFF